MIVVGCQQERDPAQRSQALDRIVAKALHGAEQSDLVVVQLNRRAAEVTLIGQKNIRRTVYGSECRQRFLRSNSKFHRSLPFRLTSRQYATTPASPAKRL